MYSDHSQPTVSGERRRVRSRSLVLPLCASLAILLVGVAVAASAGSSGRREAGRLDSSLARIAKFASRQVRPMALRLEQSLPAGAKQLKALREPASTTEEQAKVALDELRQMSLPTTLDPHYAPALVAAGQTFVAASGQDPLTRTTINPDYQGLDDELATSEARLAGSAGEAAALAARVRRLTHELSRAKRRAHRLARLLRRRDAAGQRGP